MLKFLKKIFCIKLRNITIDNRSIGKLAIFLVLSFIINLNISFLTKMDPSVLFIVISIVTLLSGLKYNISIVLTLITGLNVFFYFFFNKRPRKIL
ncbi:MAG: hypothetical protein ACRCTJ_01150, partial [Brevinema sp.]